MGPARTHVDAPPSALLAALLFCATLLGCNTTYCLVVQSNPGGTINTNSNCPSSTSTGTVTVNIGSATSSDSTSRGAMAPVRAPHIFVTLTGIDALPASMPGNDAPAWQPLAPQLAERPVQVDLNAHVGDLCAITGPPGPRLGEPGAINRLAAATIPAGAYSQLRLRVVPNQPATAASPLDASTCGANLLNCLIPPDAAAQPLVFEDPAEVVIPAGRIAGGFLRVLPDTTTHLVISFDPRTSVALPAANSLRFIPSFSVSDSACPR